jgi:enoyl-CoA hydratase/carnithine racemase
MLLEAAVFSAPEMLQRGFLSRVVAEVDLASVVQATQDRIAQLAPQAARLNKQTLRAVNPLLAQTNKALAASETVATSDPIATLLTNAYSYASSAEHREGITAFLEKRPPKF